MIDAYTLTTREVARILRVSPTTVGRYRTRDGDNSLPYRRIGGRFWYSREDLELWIKRQQGGQNGGEKTRRERLVRRRKSAKGRPRKKF